MSKRKRAAKKAPRIKQPTEPAVLRLDVVPATWWITDWPKGVIPGNASAGGRFVRMHEKELVRCGALVRIGRQKAIIGVRFMKYLTSEKHRRAVEDYTPAGINQGESNG